MNTISDKKKKIIQYDLNRVGYVRENLSWREQLLKSKIWIQFIYKAHSKTDSLPMVLYENKTKNGNKNEDIKQILKHSHKIEQRQRACQPTLSQTLLKNDMLKRDPET